jgi:hypothetical protein
MCRGTPRVVLGDTIQLLYRMVKSKCNWPEFNFFLIREYGTRSNIARATYG